MCFTKHACLSGGLICNVWAALQTKIFLNTTRKRSLGKVMFSQASVCLGGDVGTSHASWDRSHGRVPPSHIRPGDLPPPSPWTSDLGTSPPPSPAWRPPFLTRLLPSHSSPSPPPDIRTGDLLPLLLTSSDDDQKTYSLQAGGIHPTRMLSC